MIDVVPLEDRRSLFAEGQHIEDQVGDFILILFDDPPPLADHCFVVRRKSFFDQVTPPANPLQNIFNMVRENCDRLADRGEPFRLEHRQIILRILDCQRRLMTDREHQLEMVGGQFMRDRRINRCGGNRRFGDRLHIERRDRRRNLSRSGGRGFLLIRGGQVPGNIDIDHADQSVTAQHRNADRLLHTEPLDTVGGHLSR